MSGFSFACDAMMSVSTPAVMTGVVDHLRAAAAGEEVGEERVAPRLGQRVLDGERSVGVLHRVDVGELLHVAADDEQVIELVVHDSEVARLHAGQRVANA